MSEPMRFPKDPLKGTEGRIRDEFGNNLFADQDPAEAVPVSGKEDKAPGLENADNLYGTSVAEPAVYEPRHEPAVLHRGGPILGLSIVGLATAAGFSVALIWYPLTILLCPCSFALSISAVVMARSDMRAIKAGAMEPAGSGNVIVGLTLGVIGTLLSAAAIALSIYLRRGLI